MTSFGCWILNKSDRYFSVEIGIGKEVEDLKKRIKEEKKHALDGIDADRLDIWKLSLPMPSAKADELRHVQTPEEIAGCVKLGDDDDWSDHFSSLPPKHVHIVVQLSCWTSSSAYWRAPKEYHTDRART